ncbi:IclR family transcriptional regulator [Mesorhizobium sp. L-8-3]|uniref:IclR family transcriptional regulator n=1 Tax=Mesorhizobium sp. L-8-3 TaxID=2744522 RepID=UPI001FD394FE|nr:IclR family transcriptional regulator [Mesorhizobium sp. L-8-3]
MDTEYSNRISETQTNGVRPLSTVLKTMEVLDALATFPRGVKLFELADHLAISRPTAYQRLLTLVEAGWVEQIEESRYRLSLKAVGIGGAALEQANLGERTVPLLKELAAEARETASLAVLQGGQPYIVQRAEEGGLLRARQPVGTGFPLHNSASGKVLFAFADEHSARMIRAQADKVPDEATCEKVRADGYAFSDNTGDVRAVAAPVFDHRNACIAALSLVGPVSRINAPALVEPLVRTSRRLTALLQGKER